MDFRSNAEARDAVNDYEVIDSDDDGAQRFDIVPQLNPLFSARHGPYPDPVTSMYLLKRATRADGSRMGDIIPLGQLRSAIELTPSFGKKADRRLTK